MDGESPEMCSTGPNLGMSLTEAVSHLPPVSGFLYGKHHCVRIEKILELMPIIWPHIAYNSKLHDGLMRTFGLR